MFPDNYEPQMSDLLRLTRRHHSETTSGEGPYDFPPGTRCVLDDWFHGDEHWGVLVDTEDKVVYLDVPKRDLEFVSH